MEVNDKESNGNIEAIYIKEEKEEWVEEYSQERSLYSEENMKVRICTFKSSYIFYMLRISKITQLSPSPITEKQQIKKCKQKISNKFCKTSHFIKSYFFVVKTVPENDVLEQLQQIFL